MSPDQIAAIVSTVGFPIAMCIFMGGIIIMMVKTHKEEMHEVMNTMTQNTAETTKAVNNNTLALTRLLAKLDADDPQTNAI